MESYSSPRLQAWVVSTGGLERVVRYLA